MFKFFEMTLIALVLMATVRTFYIKAETEDLAADIRQLEAQIQDHEGAIDLLNADWSLLNQPNRVQNLVGAFQEQLQLDVTEPEQIVQSSELPRLKPEPDPDIDPIADAIQTGAIE